MGWDKDDYLAAIIIIIILIVGILAILWITGNIPRSDDTVYPFGGGKIRNLSTLFHSCKYSQF